MSNYCENDLHIGGPQEAVKALLALIGADKAVPSFDFEAVIPYPEPFAELDRAFREARAQDPSTNVKKDNYQIQLEDDWRFEKWGTHSFAYGVQRRDYRGHIILTFQTAGTPPRPVILALARLHPDVTLALESFEEGTAWAGGFTCRGIPDPFGSEPGVTVADEWTCKSYSGPRGG